MTRLFALIFSLLFVVGSYAQDLTVENMTVTNEVISAASQRTDLNGKACALVKVQLPVAGVVFEGSIVGDVPYVVNEYHVYMPAGTKMLNVKCPNHYPLMVNFPDHAVARVESSRVYHLRLRQQSQAAPTATDPGANYVVFNVQPAEAIVTIDGQNPIMLAADGSGMAYLPYGSHSYKVEAVGHAPESGSVNVTSGNKTVLNVKLKSQLSTLTVNAETPGTAIYVNDQFKGNSPWTGQLYSGMYRIDGRKDGHRSVSSTINLGTSETRSVTLPALQAITGHLNVSFQPIGSAVTVDGKSVDTTPTVVRDLLVGQHTVAISHDGYTPQTLTVNITEGETTPLTGSLQAAAVASQPASAPSAPSTPVSTQDPYNGHAYVDLGLPSGTKWATCNIGAKLPSDYGDYFAWGETEKKRKDAYDLRGSATELQKKGVIDSSQNLTRAYDAASVIWGGNWRMPTKEEFDELNKECTWEWTEVNGHKGYRVSGRNGNSIFLPAAGWWWAEGDYRELGTRGYYWSSAHATDMDKAIIFYNSHSNRYLKEESSSIGDSIRPVIK